MKKIGIAIPASLTSETPHLREKTGKIGLIGRAAAIFRVEEVLIYNDEAPANDGKLIERLLRYMETPPYMRRQVFPMTDEMKYVGALPPLRTPHHAGLDKSSDVSFREGLVVSSDNKKSVVEAGLSRKLVVKQPGLTPGTRIPLRAVKSNGEAWRPVKREEVTLYWGFRVRLERWNLPELLEKTSYELKIATSRYGEPMADAFEKLVARVGAVKSILVMFGSPKKGLLDVFSGRGLRLEEKADLVLNMVPDQGVETVRTEEAIAASLAILNLALSRA